MENEESVENLSMTDGPTATIVPRVSMKQSQVGRIRKALLILLGILFAFDLIYLIFVVHAYVDNSWASKYFQSNYELLWTVMSIIYDAFGLFTAYRYHKLGLRLFPWMGTICLILLYVRLGIICTTAFYTKPNVNVVYVDIIGPMIFIIMFVVSSIMLLVIIILSFKLSNLLVANNRQATTQSI